MDSPHLLRNILMTKAQRQRMKRMRTISTVSSLPVTRPSGTLMAPDTGTVSSSSIGFVEMGKE